MAVVKKFVIKIYHIVAKWQWQKKVCEKKYISDRVAKAVTEKCVKKYW